MEVERVRGPWGCRRAGSSWGTLLAACLLLSCLPCSSSFLAPHAPARVLARMRANRREDPQDYTPMPSFKGWAKPGPLAPAEGIEQDLPKEGETLDALCGHFRVFQLEKGNRFTTDDALCAWAATSWCPTARKGLDLGSGLGCVGMICAWRLPGCEFVTVEAQEMSMQLARRSARFNGLEDRYDIRLGDLREVQLGDEELFDLVTGTPPYFPLDGFEGSGPQHPQKQACRFELRGSVADYCFKAAKHLKRGGLFTCAFPITPPFQEKRVFQAAEDAELTVVRLMPVVLREGDAPLLGLFGMMRRVDVPEELMSRGTWRQDPLVIRGKDGQFTLEYSSVRLAVGQPPV